MSRISFPAALKGPVQVFSLRLPLKTPFRLAYGSYRFRENVFLLLRHRGLLGLGEAPVVPYYGDRAEETAGQLRRALGGEEGRRRLETWLADSREPLPEFLCPAARSALETALLDIRSRAAGMSLGDWLGVEGRRLPPSSYTLASRDGDEAAQAARSSPLPLFKVKLGFDGDIKLLETLRRAFPDRTIRIDVNRGWTPAEAPARVRRLEELGVELIEEPLQGCLEEVERLAGATNVPILLDESVRTPSDLEAVIERAPSVAGIVAKPAKNGGPAASLHLIRLARAAGLRVMMSSQVATSLGVTAAAHLAPLCAWCDLDAPLLLAADPWRGLRYLNGGIRLPAGPGLGVGPGPGLADMLAGFRPQDGG